jgi:hypothetical protein
VGETKRVSRADPHITQEENTGRNTGRRDVSKTLEELKNANPQRSATGEPKGLQEKRETESEKYKRLFWEKRGKKPPSAINN